MEHYFLCWIWKCFIGKRKKFLVSSEYLELDVITVEYPTSCSIGHKREYTHTLRRLLSCLSALYQLLGPQIAFRTSVPSAQLVKGPPVCKLNLPCLSNVIIIIIIIIRAETDQSV
jgi:hypothetical protein